MSGNFVIYQAGATFRAPPKVLLRATKVVITTEPSGAANGSAWSGQPVAQLQDAFNLPVLQSGISVTVSLVSGPATLSGTLTVATDANGVATFTGLTLTGQVGTHTIQVASAGLTGATSASFDLAAGPATNLVMDTEPAGAVGTLPLTQQPRVRLRDASNNFVLTAGVSVTATKHAGVSGTLSGTTSVVTDANGIAVFTDLVMSAQETGVRLDFASAGLAGAVSAAFDVATPPSTQSLPLFSEAFADNNFADRGWYSIVSADWVNTPVPAGFSGALRINWPVGAVLPPACEGMRKLFTPTDSLYLRYQLAATNNWIGNGLASEPHVILVLSDQDGDFQGPSDCFLALYSEVNYQAGNVGWVRFQDNQYIDSANIGANVSEARGTSGANGQQGYADSWDLFQSIGNFSHDWYATRNLTTGTAMIASGNTAYHTVEVEVFLNSIVGGIGQTDGICRLWCDGVLKFERTNLIMRTGTRPTLKFKQFMISPNLGVASTRDQSLFIADLQVRTRRPVTVATKLGVTTQPAGAIDNTAFLTQPVVQLQDATGSSVSQSGTTVTASILSGVGTLIGTAAVATNGSGQAVFTNLGIDASTPPADFTLQFAATGLTGVASGTVTVTVPTKLAMQTQPSGATDNVAFTTQPVVVLQNALSQTVPLAGVTVTAALASGTGSLLGTLTAITNSSGVATFTNLRIDATTPPSGFTVSFTAAGLTGVTSASFTVAAAGGGSFWLANLPPGATLIGLVDMATNSLPGDSGAPIGSTGLAGRTPLSVWTKVADYWQLTKPPGIYGSPTAGSDWGDFYCNIGALGNTPTKLYVAIERLYGSADGLGYEWHPVSNKDLQIDSSGPVAVLSQTFEATTPNNWQAFELLLSDYHPQNNLSNDPIPSDVKQVYEYLIEYSPTNRLRAFRNGVAVSDIAVPSGFINNAGGGYMEWWIHHFDGGGGNTRTRTTYIRYYRVAIYRF